MPEIDTARMGPTPPVAGTLDAAASDEIRAVPG